MLPQKEGICKDCGCEVICTDDYSNPHAENQYADYWYYCVNQKCKNHRGVEVGDMECDDEHVPFIIWDS